MELLVDGVVRGIGGYGNCVGVPTITGQTEFSSSYDKNILVNAFALGLFRPGEKVFLSKAQKPGAWVVYVGAKTGRDGVHGASMASESFGENDEAKRPTVQIGDPFLEKLLIEACLEVMKEDLVIAIQDMGAAGLTSSSFEMASKGGVGLVLRLDDVPLRDDTMEAEDILLSESQERMLLICDPEKFKRIEEIYHRWDLDATVVGEVISEKKVKLFWKEELLTEIDPDILVENAPAYDREHSAWEAKRRVNSTQLWSLDSEEIKSQILEILASQEGCSRSWVYEQYDQRVGAATHRDCSSPIGILSLPDSKRGLGIVLSCRPYVMEMDAQIGGGDAVVYGALELACKGFEPLAITDCLNYGNPERVPVMTEFVASVEAMSRMCEKLDAPVISGNVSFYNETQKESITSTPSVGMVGLRESLRGVPKQSLEEGLDVFLISMPLIESGGYLAKVKGQEVTFSGEWDDQKVAAFVRLILDLGQFAPVKGARVVGKFGLGYTLARMTIEGSGIKIDEKSLKELGYDRAASLFRERFYEVVVGVERSQVKRFQDLVHSAAKMNGLFDSVKAVRVGESEGDALKVADWLKVSRDELKERYEKGWYEIFKTLA
jgi:phosphoribosylformylglycinamidine synthase